MSHVSARIALAGEYLAASYLMRFCDSVIIAPEGHKSDLILDHQGQLYKVQVKTTNSIYCLLYTSPSPRDLSTSRMPSSA